MKRRLALLVLGLVALLVAAGELAHASPDPGRDVQDASPAWALDGVRLAFERTAPNAKHVLEMTSAGKQTAVVSFNGRLRGFDGTQRLLVESDGSTFATTGSRFQPPDVVYHGVDATPSATGGDVAYIRDGALYSAPPSGERLLATGIDPPSWDVDGPVWSPDGTQIVVASGTSLVLAEADGSASRTLFTGANQSVNPSWSPNGKVIAFERNFAAHWQIWLVNADGSDPHALVAGDANNRFPVFSPVSALLAFISDRQHVPGGATQYRFALYTQGVFQPVVRKLLDDVHPYSPPSWSPTGTLIAAAAGKECRRWGIYVGRPEAGSHFVRLSNRCRLDGTRHADFIRGSYFFDIIRGFGGDDVIHANPGDDIVFGGNGDDRIFGGSGDDLIVGGNGADRIDCGPGNDTVEAVDPRDRVTRNCEHVQR